MKCPACGDTQGQEYVGHDGGQPVRHCAKCGRLHCAPGDDLADVMLRLQQMRAKADEHLREREKLLIKISEVEAQLRAAGEQLGSAEARLARSKIAVP